MTNETYTTKSGKTLPTPTSSNSPTKPPPPTTTSTHSSADVEDVP